MVTIFNCYKLLKPIGLHLLIFGTTAQRLYWQVVWQCWSLIKLYSGHELVLSTLWMNLVQRAALRSSRVVRPVVERGARMKFQAGSTREASNYINPGLVSSTLSITFCSHFEKF